MYIKTNWQPGDTITSEKLNHIEDALAEMLNESDDVDVEGNLDVDSKGRR